MELEKFKPLGKSNSLDKKRKEHFDFILGCVRDGMSVKAACRQDGVVAAKTFYRWIDRFPQLQQTYALACQERQNTMFEDLRDTTIQDMRDGVIDSQQARVEVDVVKWMLAKMNPEKYGDTRQIKHADAHGNKLGIAQIYDGILESSEESESGLPEETA